MSMSRRLWLKFAGAVAASAALTLSGVAQDPGQGPSRDTPAQRRQTPSPAGKISGRVLGADNGRPLSRAVVRVSAAELPGGRSTLTDASGAFTLGELPPGRYTVTASKTGYVGLAFGQRRPLQAGTPLQLADRQELRGIDFRLPRGSAITGHVYDEGGEPLPGVAVRVMRYQYAQGARQLTPAGGAQTDDRGEFRVWGLDPGEYYVSALARNFNLAPGRLAFPPGGLFGRGALALGRGGPLAAVDAAQSNDSDQEAYAPTYYPGVASVHEARAVSVGLAAEVLGIDFGVLLVRTSRVSGRVTNPDGSFATGGNVTLVPDVGPGRVGGPMGSNYSTRIQGDGTFAIPNVPPGRYVLRARGEPARGRGRGNNLNKILDTGAFAVTPQFAAMPVTVNGDIRDLVLALSPGATIGGRVALEAAQSPVLPNLNQLRIFAPSLDVSALDVNPPARVDPDGGFTIEGVPAGLHWIRGQAPRGWALKSVIVDGRDIIDTPFEVRNGERISGVSLIFTDKLSEINGTITDRQGTPIPDFTVLAFPTDSTLWRPQARQIMTSRPDQHGRFQLRGLPPGDYYLATIDPAEPGEWFEPAFLEQQRAGATRVRLGEGDVRTQDFSR